MKKLQLKRRATTLLTVFVALFATSCNRGYGCPTNFSVDVDLIALFQQIAALLF